LKRSQIPLDPPFSKGEKLESFIEDQGEALLPLKKGGREGFLARPFSYGKSDTIDSFKEERRWQP
jgi:hypothetical protein